MAASAAALSGKKRGAEEEDTRPSQRARPLPTPLSAPDAVLIHTLGQFLNLGSRAALVSTSQRHRANVRRMNNMNNMPGVASAVEAASLGIPRSVTLFSRHDATRLLGVNPGLDPTQLWELTWTSSDLLQTVLDRANNPTWTSNDLLQTVLDRTTNLRKLTLARDPITLLIVLPSSLTTLAIESGSDLSCFKPWPEGLTTLAIGRVISSHKPTTFPSNLTSLVIKQAGQRTLEEKDIPPFPATLTSLEIPQFVKMHGGKLTGWFPALQSPVRSITIYAPFSSLYLMESPWTLPAGVEEFDLDVHSSYRTLSELFRIPGTVKKLTLNLNFFIHDPDFRAPADLDVLALYQSGLYRCPKLVRGCRIDTLRVIWNTPSTAAETFPYWDDSGVVHVRRLELPRQYEHIRGNWPPGLEEIRVHPDAAVWNTNGSYPSTLKRIEIQRNTFVSDPFPPGVEVVEY